MKQIDLLLEGLQLRGELGDGDRLHMSQNRRDDGVVLQVEAGADVGNEFLVVDGLARCCHVISKGTHLADVLIDRHSSLLHSANVMRVFTAHARVWDANSSSIVAHKDAAVPQVETCLRTSRERDARR